MNRRQWMLIIVCLLGCTLIGHLTGAFTKRQADRKDQEEPTFERELKPWDLTKYIAPEPIK
jgi:hypothetical protein